MRHPLVSTLLAALLPVTALAAGPDTAGATQAAPAATRPTAQVAGRLAAPVAAGDTAPVTLRKPATKKPKGKADPRRTRGLFVDPLMPAANHGAAYRALGSTPQALWITDAYPASRVRSVVRAYVRRAAKVKKTPMLAIYAIPARDCGLYSSGGWSTAAGYRTWIKGIAKGLAGTKPLVVLEPDALPFLGACSGQGDRTGLLAWAGKRLTEAGAWVYLDAGHSDWQPADVMAARLKAAGVGAIRGYALNVANFRPTAEIQAYASKIDAALARLGIHGRTYVVDTSRNGAADPVDGDVCNPTWARVGAYPQLVFRGSFDGTLWVKHPGESDGPCNGGPPSGQWSSLLADRLLGRSS